MRRAKWLSYSPTQALTQLIDEELSPVVDWQASWRGQPRRCESESVFYSEKSFFEAEENRGAFAMIRSLDNNT
jgi:hypothetical protein